MSFYFSWYGNKKKECKHLRQWIDREKYDTIVEPFCGTFAFSLFCYYELGMKDATYVLRDNDKMLIDFLLDVKAHGSKTYFDYANTIVCDSFTKDKHNAIVAKRNDDLKAWFYSKKCFQFRPLLFPHRQINKPFVRTKEHERVDAFLKLPTVSIACQSYEQTFAQHKGKVRTLLFIDPPYLDSCNETYSAVTNEGGDGTAVYRDIKRLVEADTEARALCVLNNNALMSLVFDGHVLHEYAVKYGNTGRKATHLIVGRA